MKKIITCLLTGILVLTAAGCAGRQTSGKPAADDSWDKVQSAGKLVLGLDKAFPPMGFVDPETGDLTGFDIDMATEVCKRLGIELKLQPIDWKNQTAELNNGNVDCLWNGLSKTQKRDEEMNLSVPYMTNNQIILVKAGSTFKGLAGLAGKTIGVQSGSSAETALNDSANADFKQSLKETVGIDDYSKAVMEMKNGTIDAIAIDEVVARYYLTKNPDAYEILQDSDGKDISLAVEDYVVGFRRNDSALKGKVEGALKAMSKDGTAAKISKKWFGKDVVTIDK